MLDPSEEQPGPELKTLSPTVGGLGFRAPTWRFMGSYKWGYK